MYKAMSPAAALRRAARRHQLGGFVIELPIAGAWASRLAGEALRLHHHLRGHSQQSMPASA